MKKLSVLLLLAFIGLSGLSVHAQDNKQIVYNDTINVNLDQLKGIKGNQLLIGKVKADDPEQQSLYYDLLSTFNKPIFSIDADEGFLYADMNYLNYLCEKSSFGLTISVSDGTLTSTSNIIVYFKCNNKN